MSLGCTVAELLERISAKELTEWQAYDQLEPFGPKAVNLNTGIIASGYANCHRKKDTAYIKPDKMALGDFGYGEEDSKGGVSGTLNTVKNQTVEEQKQMVFAIAGAFGTKETKAKLK